MKKQMGWRLCLIIMTTMLLTLIVNLFLQVNKSRESMVHSSQIKVNQIREILLKNTEDVKQLKLSLKEDYTIRAKAAAFILENHPEAINSLDELKSVASLLQVDELHVFDDTGRIYSGTEPKYYGYTFDSGVQMQFFKEMLNNKTLELAQDVMPNTAEGKYMQYAAVWQENGENIIQIGMESSRLVKAMEKNELSYIFSMVTSEEGTTLLVIDKETGRIAGSTEDEMANQTVKAAGIVMPNDFLSEKGFRCWVDGVEGYGYFKDYGNQYIGVLQENRVLYHGILPSMMMVVLYLSAISIIMILAILQQLDKNVIQGIDEIVDKTTEIIEGNLETEVHVTTTPEFRMLSDSLNQMVNNLIGGTAKLSRIFELADAQIGVFEYNTYMTRVLATKKLGTLLLLSPSETAKLLADKQLFETKLQEIRANELPDQKDVYRLNSNIESYLKIQIFSENGEVLGIITDVTEEVREWHLMKYDRDYDLLTTLLNRRGFYRQMDLLFRDKSVLKNAVMLMLDMNQLKYINDNFGHASGDKAIQAAGMLLKQCPAPHKVMARLSGDEFILFLYGEERETLQKYIEELHQTMMETFIVCFEQTQVPIRLSGGYLFYPEYDVTYSKMLSYADKAMYRSKKARNAEFLLYDPEKDRQ